ncbi:ferredoxin-type protein NapF [Vibrio renipiscarius]|uniref:Ferredoxin-type protein NapF n=1 Tax=Vibrio renipiscarius TaxID=1461322 RepID=A0A0C2NXE3_9VIBR|nr:ferredoxin-type protein NapF [Vibrio renipiscarius]KII75424.1 ferredoxin [Vibrio renipiscarius]KII78877.1 ferredoxin [Vibrio renipiscarius]
MVDFSRRKFFTRKPIADAAVRLPWLLNPEQFTDLCTQCGECVKACETQIIVKGDGGFPRVDFAIDECTFCYQCAEACPESLFKEESDTPWQAKADINQQCLAKQNVECRACNDMCESMAIQFSYGVGRVALPTLDHEKCNGCGACVAVCPTSSINVSNVTV